MSASVTVRLSIYPILLWVMGSAASAGWHRHLLTRVSIQQSFEEKEKNHTHKHVYIYLDLFSSKLYCPLYND